MLRPCKLLSDKSLMRGHHVIIDDDFLIVEVYLGMIKKSLIFLLRALNDYLRLMLLVVLQRIVRRNGHLMLM